MSKPRLHKDNPNRYIREYDKKFDAWWIEITTHLWGPGTLPDLPDAAQFDPYGCFDEGWSVLEFVQYAKAKLTDYANARRSN